MLVLEPRKSISKTFQFLSPVLALLLTLVSGLIVFTLLGHPPFKALYAFFIAPINNAYGLSELLVKASPLILIALGLAVGFRANVWNIGAEGQLIFGALIGSILPIYFSDSSNPIVLPLMLLMGMAGGMAWAAIPAYLKIRFNTNEILTSLMLTYVAALLLSFLVHGPWRDPQGFNFPESVLFPDVAILPIIWSGTRAHFGIILTVIAVLVIWWMLSKSLTGFKLRAFGEAPKAAAYAGFRQPQIIRFSLLLAGGLAGLAGVIEVAGPIGQLQSNISPGYGFTAIIVAFLGRLHPLGIVFGGLVLALSYLGGESVQISMGLPKGIAGVFQGLLLFFLLACDVLTRYRLRRVRLTGD